jgi:RTX calcium-binding nonapeptide repeat (4 copies)
VTTGTGNDTVTGNAAANVITTSGGGDTVTGGAGTDTVTPGSGTNNTFVRDGEVDTVNCTSLGSGDSIISDFASPVDVLNSCGSAKLNDADNDGVSEPSDQCPSQAAPGQANGCPPPPPTTTTPPPAAAAPVHCPKGKKLVKGKCVKKKKKKK